MPKSLPWVLKSRFESVAKYEAFKFTLPNTVTITTNHVNCQVCKKSGSFCTSKHEMAQSYLTCSSRSCFSKPMFLGLCPAKYKLEICNKTEMVLLYQLNEHNDGEATYRKNLEE